MIKNIFIAFALVLFFSAGIRSQNIDLKLKENKSSQLKQDLFKINPGVTKKADLPTPLLLLGIVLFINPMVVFEDKKVFFGLTKEISVGVYQYGRIAFEYSYIFRSYNTSHLRVSYIYDAVFETDYFVPADINAGVGYFTDTKNKGWFLQGSAGVLVPTSHCNIKSLHKIPPYLYKGCE
jgi:hypothetical protein